jgi:hypothetical protein
LGFGLGGEQAEISIIIGEAGSEERFEMGGRYGRAGEVSFKTYCFTEKFGV